MTYDPRGGGALDYYPCRYGASKLLFRGPRRKADGTHVAVLGGCETYGRFIPHPYADLLEKEIGRPVLNLGLQNAGIDVFLQDKTVGELCQSAAFTVIELTGAHNVSNRFYSVHPRRNDRFLRASTLLKTIYRDVDFTEFHFTRHLLTGLRDNSAEKFDMIVTELKEAWVARMRSLLSHVGGKVMLLWLSDRQPDRSGDEIVCRSRPLFVDAHMVNALRGSVEAVVEVVADADELHEGYAQMVFSELDAPAAAEMLGPVVHRRAAQRLAEAIQSR